MPIWQAERHFMGLNGTTTAHRTVVRCMEPGCDASVRIDPMAARAENAEALEGWSLTTGRMLCPDHSGSPPWVT
jgi:hypothetical protein